MKKIAKLFTAIAVVFTAFSCADLDIDNDGRVAMQDIFGRYERTVSYYSNCINYMPKVSLDYGTSVMLPTHKVALFPIGIKDIPLRSITL